MSTDSGIEWTDATWNPVVGCTPVSPGCLNCYAATFAARGMHPTMVGLTVRKKATEDGATRAVFNGTVRCLPERLAQPLRWRKPRRVFVNSMSDLFHEAVPFEFIDRVFAVMALAPQHTFQVLTKRPERMAEYLGGGHRGIEASRHRGGGGADPHERVYEAVEELVERLGVKSCGRFDWPWPLPNVWLGTSVEDQPQLKRAWDLLKCPAAVRFLSVEPLIGPVDLDALELLCKSWRKGATIGVYLDWVIVGGESGPHARPCDVGWVRSVVAQCKAAGVPCFVKQLGANPRTDYTDEELCRCEKCGYINLIDAFDVGGADEGKLFCNKCSAHGAHEYWVTGKGGDPAEWPEDLRVREVPA